MDKTVFVRNTCKTVNRTVKSLKPFLLAGVLACVASNPVLQAQKSNAITVKANQIKGDIQPTMWGVFFEDINLGADGGIYAELVKNSSFEFSKPLMGWNVRQNNFDEGSV